MPETKSLWIFSLEERDVHVVGSSDLETICLSFCGTLDDPQGVAGKSVAAVLNEPLTL